VANALMASLLSAVACSHRAPIHCRATAGGTEAERWQDHLGREAAEGFSGAVCVAEGVEVVLSAEYGGAERDGGPTAFWIASISKAITAAAVLHLVEAGKLALHEPLSEYLDGVPDRWKAVSVHHLLGHRSGFGHHYAADGIADRQEALRALLAQEPVKPLGQFEYSNDGYTLLAILIETRSGETFESYVRSRIFGPARMEHAGFWGDEPNPSPVAPPADSIRAGKMSPRIWRHGRSVSNWGYRGATGIYATPEDLYRFITALRRGILLQEETVAEMLSSKNPAIGPDAQTYGYGMALRLRAGRVVEYFHGGNEDWLGHNGMLDVLGDRIYVILTNCGDLGSESWAHRIEAGLKACADPR
jgi:CubicO group peptidase (beta-lactamase class C family)